VRILYLHPAAAFGGASKSLIELFGRLRETGVQGLVLTPAGSVCEAFSKAGLEVCAVRGLSQVDNTQYGHYRRLRWIILLRELWFLPFCIGALWRMRRESFDLIHINEVTLLPLGILAKLWLRLPLVVHVRSLQCAPGSSRRTRWVNAWVRRYADAVVAIDHTVARTLESGLPLSVVHNAIHVDAGKQPLQQARGDGPVRVGYLGVLLGLKGIFELAEAIRILKERELNIECIVAGENARQLSGFKAWVLGRLGFSRDVRKELEAFIAHHGLQKEIKLIGFVADVRTLYPSIDILCFPSHLNAAGRPVFEAAFFGVPSIVAVEDPPPDSILHGITGLALPRPDPVLIADAIQRLVLDDRYRWQLGAQARNWAEANFAAAGSAASMLAIYRRLLGRDRSDQLASE
jgi:glycosyltransferase involved in cell wall biosynthesis